MTGVLLWVLPSGLLSMLLSGLMWVLLSALMWAKPFEGMPHAAISWRAGVSAAVGIVAGAAVGADAGAAVGIVAYGCLQGLAIMTLFSNK